MKTFYFIIIYLIFACSGIALAQEIPNGDGDLLWERSYGRFGEAKFHPLNGNIISTIENELWEINPKDGNVIRKFEGETGMQYNYGWLDISNNGNYIVVSTWKGISLWDYSIGKLIKILPFSSTTTVGIFPNTNIVLINQGSKLIKFDYITEQIIQEKVNNESYINYARLTKDGKYIGVAKTINNSGDWYYYMELWDAETLTKIRDFGSPGDIIEFRDVQISDDNKYVGFLCGGSREINLFNIGNSKLIKRFENTAAFSFTPNSKIIVYSGTKPENAQSNIYTLPTLDTVYQYIWARSFFRFNESNEMFTGNKMYSSRWYNVSVNEPKDPQAAISPNPATDYIEVNVGANGHLPLQEIRLFDIFGKPVLFVETGLRPVSTKIDISNLPAGVYFVRIGNEKPLKFIKI